MKRLLCVMACAIMLTGCGKGEVVDTTVENNETSVNEEITGDIYNDLIAGLGEEESYAIIENDAKYPILLVSSGGYDDGMGNWAALESDVYYVVDGEVKNIGAVMSGGTAYPISYSQTGIYSAGGHYVAYYEINEESGSLVSKEMYHEIFDETGTATYTKVIDGVETESSEEELAAIYEDFSNATVVNYNRLAAQLETGNTCDETEGKTINKSVVITKTNSYGSKSVSEYDEVGKIITYMNYYDDGSLHEWKVYEYDSEGNRIKSTGYNEDGDITCWDEYEYDSMGNLTKVVQNMADGSVRVVEEHKYEYDNLGNITKDDRYGYEYDSQGNVIKGISYNEDGSVGAVLYECEYDSSGNQTKYVGYQDGSILYWNEYEYDLQGNRTKQVGLNLDGVIESNEYEYDSTGNETKWIKYNEDGSIQWRLETEYDNYGNQTKYVYYLPDGSIDRCGTYEYEYDNYGNVTKSVYNKDGRFVEWAEYTYDFHGTTPQYIAFNEDDMPIIN